MPEDAQVKGGTEQPPDPQCLGPTGQRVDAPAPIGAELLDDARRHDGAAPLVVAQSLGGAGLREAAQWRRQAPHSRAPQNCSRMLRDSAA